MAVPTPQEAIESAYRDYGTQLWRGVYAYSGGRADIADEAVAEAFARALEGTEPIRSLLPWLYRVAFRQAAERLRREDSLDPLEDVSNTDDTGDSTNPALDALALLSPRQRAAVFLFYYADFSITEVADATGSSRIAVRVQLHRAREALRRRYGSAAAMRDRSPKGGTDERELV
jgi:RNA polymerase sigma-70 factor (ECF subfamily)